MTQPSCIRTTPYYLSFSGPWASGLALLSLSLAASACGDMDELAAEEEEQIETRSSAIVSATPWFSEEQSAVYCPQGTAMMGIRCSGRFCDNVSMYCDDYPGLTGASYWTTYFSEEGSNYRACANDEVVTGMQCAYRFCDRIRFRCTRTTQSLGSCAWSGQISEENSPLIGSSGRFVQGISCRGSYCDNKQLLYCSQPRNAASCNGQCGGYAGSCYCDTACTYYGDCCADYAAFCQ